MPSKFRTIVMAATMALLVYGTASAQVDYQGPDMQNYPPSCLDTYGDPLTTCFSDTIPGADQTISKCDVYYSNCYKACATQQLAEMKACDSMQDPVLKADCIATADENAQACDNTCDTNYQMGFCF